MEQDVDDVLGSIAIAIMSYQAPSFTLSDPSYLAILMMAILIFDIPSHRLQLFSATTTDLACPELIHKNHTVSLLQHVQNHLVGSGGVELA